ncbi:MAG: aldo/keto reductase [Spirochaetaceae bacterium]|nr:aldo/keto reductase [Spirochaetaceae bacterium]
MRFPRALGAIDMKKTSAMITEAVERGINYFDTAWIYPGSEEALGTVLDTQKLREKVHIASKLPIIACKSAGDFDKYFLQSLKRLKTNYIDYYLMHMLTDMGSWEKLKSWGIIDWIKEKKQSGAIQRIGFSFHGGRDDFLALLAAYDWEFCQIQYNYSNENYQAGQTGLKAAAEKGIPVIIMEPLLGGRLINGLPKAAREAFKKADPARAPAAWGLDWLWNQKEVSVVLSGMSSMKQLEENIKIAENAHENSLSPAQLAVFDEVKNIFNASYKVPCTGCAYCMPCPQNINIPGCFAAYNASFAFSYIEGLKQYVNSAGVTSASPRMAGQCVKCRQCEKHCPQNIKISEVMKDVKARLEPLWLRIIRSLIRRSLPRRQNHS